MSTLLNKEKAPRIARILRLSCRYCFQWSIELIHEWLVGFLHFWHFYEVARRQKSWCNWKTTHIATDQTLRNVNTETSSDSSHVVIPSSSHLAIKIISINVVTSFSILIGLFHCSKYSCRITIWCCMCWKSYIHWELSFHWLCKWHHGDEFLKKKGIILIQLCAFFI